ncbi:hypothetical protein [Cupriavidus sp. YAF13]|uniref:hypothetical protein n=1 Tax=Cupriavidus sp. YAF13 TaxID=3233075 RepID=UPI003F909714
MNYEEFFREAAQLSPTSLDLPLRVEYRSSLDNEALFQLPLLAMVILTLSKGGSKPRRAELGQVVGECLERTVAGFKGSSQDIGWSANLRIRTVNALTFLERAGLVAVDAQQVAVTPRGRPLIAKVLEQETVLADALLTIERSYDNIRAERLIRMEV